MQALELNLATRPFKNNAPLWLGLVGSVIALGAFTVFNLMTYGEYTSKMADLSERIGQVEAKRGELERREREAQRAIEGLDLDALTAKTIKANEVIRWKAFSWTRLFNLLQSVQPHSVQMTAIRPIFRADADADGRQTVVSPEIVPVSVEGTARGLLDFLAFERALIDDPHFARPEPENTDTDEQTRETVFRLRFWYDPRVPLDGREELSAEAEEAAGEPVVDAAMGEAEGVRAAAAPASEPFHTPPPAEEAPAVVEDPSSEEPPPERPRKRGGGGRRRKPPPVDPSTEPAPTDVDPGED